MFLGIRSTTMPSLTCSNPSSSLNLRHRRLCKPHSLYFSSHAAVQINHRRPVLGNQESYELNNPLKCSTRLFNPIKAKGKSDDPKPDDPVPPAKRSSDEWKKWMVGMALSMILPSYRYRHKWGPLIFLRTEDKVEETIETVELMTEITEELGEAVGKVAEAVESKIPEQDAKLKEVVETIDHLAKEAVKEAEEAKRLINEVEKAEKQVEVIVGIQAK